MRDAHVLGNEFILRPHIIVKRHLWEWPRTRLVGWRGGLAISEQGWNYNEEIPRVQELVVSDQPEVVGKSCRQY